MPNNFVWYELMTTDAPSATAFYREVVGWGEQDGGEPGKPYTLLTAGQTPVAGLMPTPSGAGGAKPGWIGYIGVDDVDAFADRVKGAGGSVLRGAEDISVGRFAVVADLHGAPFVLFKANSKEGGSLPSTAPGHVGWRELSAGDGVSAFAFYSGLFGWTKDEAMDMGPMGVYQLFAAGGEATGAVMTKTPEVPAPFWLFYFNVDDITAAVDRVTGKGGQIINGPMEVPGEMWIIQGLDPQGAMFALVGPRR